MIRVLIVSPTGGHAGIDVCLENLVLGLDRNRFEPIVVFPQNALLKPRFEEEGIRCYELPLSWWFPIGYSNSDILAVIPTLRSKVDPLVHIIKDNQVDVVMSNTSVALDGAIAAGICGVPHVFFLHAQFVPNIYVDMLDETREFVYTLMGKLSTKLVCCSRFLHEAFSRYADNSVCIYNGVDVHKFVFKPKKMMEGKTQIRMVCVGHYNVNKQQDFVLRALNVLQNERPDIFQKVSFTMIGPGEEAYKELLQNMIQEYRLQDHVLMEDFRDDIHEYLENYNIYINSSITENLPVSVIEAMSCGLPALGSVNEGTLQLIENGKNGFLCENPEAMAQKIIELVENPASIEMMSYNARSFVEDNFSVEKYVNSFQDLFAEISQSRSSKAENRFIKNMYESLTGLSLGKFPFKKVLVIYPPAAMPTYMLGVKYPFELLKEAGVLDYTSITPGEFTQDMLKRYDVVLCVRFYDDTAYNILKLTQNENVPFVWLIDDNYSGLHVENGKVIHEEKSNPLYERMYVESSHVIVFSGDMYHFGKKLTNDITRVPTIQPDNREYMKLSSRDDGKIVLGFMGTTMRDTDFLCVVPAIERLLEKYGSDIRVEFVGYCPEELRNRPGVECFDFIPDYEEFRKFFAGRKWDIGLAPLSDTLFNRCKTNNKYREYSSYRIAGVYSNIAAYSCVEHCVNGYLTENTEDAWFEAVSRLIEDRELRSKIAENAHADVLENYSVEKYAKIMMRIFCEACSDILSTSMIPGAQKVIRKAEGSFHCAPAYSVDDIYFAGILNKQRRWGVRCQSEKISHIGLLLGILKDSQGTVTVKIYQSGQLLSEAQKCIREIDFTTWNYFSFKDTPINNKRLLTIEVLTDIEDGSLGVFENSKKRTFWYKVFNKLGYPIPGKDVLMVDFI